MARSANGFGMNLLSYTEIDAWARLTRRVLSAWEVAALKALDVLYLNTQTTK